MTNPIPTRAEVEALKMRPVRRKHVFHGPGDHANSWESDSCQACVLSLCKVCQGAEASLPTDCPGRKMTCEEEDAVQNGTLDFVRDCWVVPRAYAATLDAPQTVPVVEGKPTSAEINALAASAQKAALEAEARVVEMREACIAKLESMSREYDTVSAHAGKLIAASNALRALPLQTGDRFMRLLEAMQELYDMPVRSRLMTGFAHGALTRKEYEDAWLTVKAIVREALSLFPQPEEQP